ncbi:uncharacterized protein LOC125582352 [Brassica napus]|uniref:uncharacterized protein LOC125582352 n=1 Tax=Brassica napus TaxID=3708 RepID=UPI002078ADBF|nr:uncharacterized protein LOC125582352 [Brassica napus]
MILGVDNYESRLIPDNNSDELDCLRINDFEPFCQDELALYRQCAENRDKVLRVRLQESEHKLGMSMPIDLAKERITQLEAKATSLERHLILASGAEGIERFLIYLMECTHGGLRRLRSPLESFRGWVFCQ